MPKLDKFTTAIMNVANTLVFPHQRVRDGFPIDMYIFDPHVLIGYSDDPDDHMCVALYDKQRAIMEAAWWLKDCYEDNCQDIVERIDREVDELSVGGIWLEIMQEHGL